MIINNDSIYFKERYKKIKPVIVKTISVALGKKFSNVFSETKKLPKNPKPFKVTNRPIKALRINKKALFCFNNLVSQPRKKSKLP